MNITTTTTIATYTLGEEVSYYHNDDELKKTSNGVICDYDDDDKNNIIISIFDWAYGCKKDFNLSKITIIQHPNEELLNLTDIVFSCKDELMRLEKFFNNNKTDFEFIIDQNIIMEAIGKFDKFKIMLTLYLFNAEKDKYYYMCKIHWLELLIISELNSIIIKIENKLEEPFLKTYQICNGIN